MNWKFLGTVPEGQTLKINGIDVWSQKWVSEKGEFAEVQDPLYSQQFKFHVYTIRSGDMVIKFAAGEFSNGMWGFYAAD